MTAYVLEARGLCKTFASVTAVDNLDIAVAPGEVYALLGPNGAGKTTTLNLFLGFLAPDAGVVEVGGFDAIGDGVAAKRRLAYLPEQVALYPSLTGLHNLEYFARLSGHELSGAELGRCLSEAGLERAAHDRRVSTYSKGMRQKVGIALALAKEANAVLLDEPTSGLDPAASAEFSRIVRTLASAGAGVLMATHDIFRVKSMATRIGVIVGGRLREELRGEALRKADLEELYLGHVQTQHSAPTADEVDGS